MASDLPLAIVVLSAIAIVMLKVYWPESVSNGGVLSNGIRDVTRNIARALLMITILVVITSLGFHVLHFDITSAWTQTILAFTVAGYFAGSMGNALFDRVWPRG